MKLLINLFHKGSEKASSALMEVVQKEGQVPYLQDPVQGETGGTLVQILVGISSALNDNNIDRALNLT